MVAQLKWQRLSELYSAVLKCEPHERTAFLENACGDDREMLGEIEEMLLHASSADAVLDRPHPAASILSKTLSPTPILQSGDLLAERFLVRRFVGRGGMGEVYEALDVDLGETIALKTLPLEVSSDEATIAMCAESLISPSIIRPAKLTHDIS